MKSEQDFVNFLEKLKSYDKNIIKGIGDDCSIISFNSKKKYVFTTDTSLLGPHFTKEYTPEEIGYKCLATNISDIASMGCMPLYAMYAITLPKMSENWIKKFYKGSKRLLSKYEISIIGGEEYFLKAQRILNNAQGDQKATGWKSYEGNYNRYWLIENLLHNDFKPLREASYVYHSGGLDILSEKAELGRDEITSALYSVKTSADRKQGSYLLKIFFDAKADEITNIYSDGFISNKNELVEMLKQIDPANISKWDRILQEKRN